jgi:hypothetical protein
VTGVRVRVSDDYHDDYNDRDSDYSYCDRVMVGVSYYVGLAS